MERYELKRGDAIQELVDAAERSGEVAIMRDGSVIATVKSTPPAEPQRTGQIDWDALDAFHAKLPPGLRGANTAALIVETRDMDDH